MNVYEKLASCRVELQNKQLKKTGVNKFAGFTYYELADILPTINALFLKAGLVSNFSIMGEIAQLEIIDTEKPTDKIIFSSNTAEAGVKGASPIQNLGSVHTYLKRYLYFNALEIVEADAVDTDGTEKEADYRALIGDIIKKQKLDAKEICARFGLSKTSTNAEYKKAYEELTKKA